MAPFIVNHPTLLNNWVLARETALKKLEKLSMWKKKIVIYLKNYLKKSIKKYYFLEYR